MQTVVVGFVMEGLPPEAMSGLCLKVAEYYQSAAPQPCHISTLFFTDPELPKDEWERITSQINLAIESAHLRGIASVVERPPLGEVLQTKPMEPIQTGPTTEELEPMTLSVDGEMLGVIPGLACVSNVPDIAARVRQATHIHLTKIPKG